MGLLRRDGPGRQRHLVRARDAADARDRAPRPDRDRGARCWRSPREHRDTVMLGRTHGQPGLPITFGFKAAGWAAEVQRHLAARRGGRAAARGRPARRRRRHAVGVRRARPGAQRRAAGAARPRRAGHELADGARPDRRVHDAARAVTGTLAKIGNEVYNLQRPEIGELSEAPTEGVVGSITMPQKRNPERSEHLVTLARVVRAGAGLALEGLVGEHERDGAAWKTEWAFLPEACSAAAVVARARRASSSPACGSTPSGCARTSTPRAATCSPSR